ncbi:ABC transporter permease [Lactiplantibacillus paraplantarum]|uniref:Transport permease protein n=1 Tax=Lactiplantibacillus paraplantarum TaxID=60520 RepID=A0AAD0TMG1_9LACO|nr:ABC transporter permease [Lactiplantibacillus paraplantarum]AVW10501.1 ABC transporter permease [Lactiplantibacillus paraplantarum]AYJ38744.1 ABC transporter permease [Lactiplantibacillus paraplantarum]ERL44816.1 ABC transporter, permease protein [Lactiplantibacillus paraplantarum]KRL51490.1 ABC transporter permease [Lactiplantibacillus paraplantarum DSM 10667]MCU4683832.1 ABC transporter permease [Lactiplantibacillus paraplantarum]
MAIKQLTQLSHILTMTHRNLLKTWHNPDNISDVVMQPVIFTLLFGYLFGGAIAGSVHAYLPMLVTGILVQSILNAASGSGQQLREDINAGVFDRFKTLPISPIVPLAGQLMGDVLRLLISGIMALVTASMMGWRPTVSPLVLVSVLLLAVFVGWSLSWVFVLVGLMVKNAALIGSLSMIIILVLTFLSNAFIPTKTLPHMLQIVVRLNPVSLTITAIRTILQTGQWGLNAFVVLLSSGLIIVIFMPLTVLAYRRFS